MSLPANCNRKRQSALTTVVADQEESSVEPTHAVAGIDPHKNTATIALGDLRGGLHETASFAITEAGMADMLAFLLDSELLIDRIGVEGPGSLGRPLVIALAAAGYDVREVQPNRIADRRRRRRRAKTDIEDAEAIARETLTDPDRPPAGKHATPDPAWEQLLVISEWRASFVMQRVRLLTEAEAVLVSLPVPLRVTLHQSGSAAADSPQPGRHHRSPPSARRPAQG
ncbi:IS110 family transposase [Nonomuraea polychroma]|uniref:IS110 family transposase n=1 Tax=Nonomuraea polychroma TaxID=46176 RepID=UPI003D92DBE1